MHGMKSDQLGPVVYNDYPSSDFQWLNFSPNISVTFRKGSTPQHPVIAVSPSIIALNQSLLAFFHDRLKVMLRDQGARHDLVDAVIGAGENNDNLLLIVRRVDALGKFLDTEDGKNLLAGWKRAASLVTKEEKKDGEGAFNAAPDAALLQADEEKALATALATALPAAASAMRGEQYADAMTALSQLRGPVDAFFEHVQVNVEDAARRANRLRLLNQLRSATSAVADFSKISG